jgi:hypothetical protein
LLAHLAVEAAACGWTLVAVVDALLGSGGPGGEGRRGGKERQARLPYAGLRVTGARRAHLGPNGSSSHVSRAH